MSLSERVLQLDREIGATVERAIAELRHEIAQRLRASNEEIHRRLDDLTPSLPASFLSHEDFAAAERELDAGARRGTLRSLRDGLVAIDRVRSQAEILTALLRESRRYASRAALLLARGNEMRGWGSEGFSEAEPAIRSLILSGEDGPWGRLLQGQGALRLAAGDCAALCSRIESPLPREGVLVPIVLRDRVAAALYADRLADGELNVEALQILAYAAAQAIETLPFRERAATSTLKVADEDAAPEGAAAVAEPTAEPVATEVEVEAEPEPMFVPPTVQEVAAAELAGDEGGGQRPGTPWTAEDEQSAVAIEPEPPPAAWEAPLPRYTEELPALSFAEAAALRPDDRPLSAPGSPAAPAAMEEEVPRYPRSVEPESTAPVRLPEASPQATVLLQRSALQQAEVDEDAPVGSPPLRPVPAPIEPGAPPPLASGTPEVRPPSGVEGPGWAFATTRVPVSPNNESLHEEARRLARLLVSEIKLYNEEQVDEGRRNRDVYERLKEDIDRSRQMYDERVDPQILRSTDYFYQELVRILAAGDSRALGI